MLRDVRVPGRGFRWLFFNGLFGSIGNGLDANGGSGVWVWVWSWTLNRIGLVGRRLGRIGREKTVGKVVVEEEREVGLGGFSEKVVVAMGLREEMLEYCHVDGTNDPNASTESWP